jgi:hypothetical protein
MLKNKLFLILDYIRKNKKNILLVLLNIIICIICFILLNKIIFLGFKLKGIRSMMSFMKKSPADAEEEFNKLINDSRFQIIGLTIIMVFLSVYAIGSISKSLFYYIYYDQLKMFSEFLAFQEYLEKNEDELKTLNHIEEFKKYKEFQENLAKK